MAAVGIRADRDPERGRPEDGSRPPSSGCNELALQGAASPCIRPVDDGPPVERLATHLASVVIALINRLRWCIAHCCFYQRDSLQDQVPAPFIASSTSVSTTLTRFLATFNSLVILGRSRTVPLKTNHAVNSWLKAISQDT